MFAELDKSKSKIKTLRKAQQEILSHYFEKLQKEKRLGIKLPTGSGKSLIAILILEAWRRSGKVAAILTANKGLADDIRTRCEEIGVPCATIFSARGDSAYRMQRTLDLLQYKKAKKIGVFNYHSYLYGTEYRQEISPPDILIIDDASEFEIPRNEFFTIRISRAKHSKVYQKIISTLSKCSHLYPNIFDFERNNAKQTAVELVYFTHSSEVWKIIREHLQELKKDLDFMYSYERNLNRSSSFLIFISNDEIELRPLLIPETLTKMSNVGQTIFMSATLPDEELLHKIFGIRTSKIVLMDENQLTKEAAEEIKTLGKRLIFPLDLAELSAGLDAKYKEIVERLVKEHNKVLVLTNSNYEADSIGSYLVSKGIRTITYSNPEDGQFFARDVASGVLICPNRYLGLDFPGKSCQVEVIVRLPSIWDTVDAFHLSVLNDSYYVEQRIANRLIQSLGRCNRLPTDEAIYYILDSRILSRIAGEEQYLRHFPQNLYGELLTGYTLSEGGDATKAIEYGRTSFFGKKDSNYEKFLEDTKSQWSPTAIDEFISKYDLEIEAWEKSLVSSYELAGQLFDFIGEDYKKSCGDSQRNLEILAAFSYYLSAMNYYFASQSYGTPQDKKECLNELKKSIEQGGNTSWFNNLRAIFNELVETETDKLPVDFVRTEVRQVKQEISQVIDDFIVQFSSKNRNWKDSYNEMARLIEEGNHEAMVGALQKFFELLGFKAVKGNNSINEPDLMAFSPAYDWKYILSIEVKTKEKAEIESKKSVAQTVADSGVVESRYKDYKVYAVLVTQKEEVDTNAVEVAQRKVSILRTSTCSILVKKIYEKMNEWEGLSTKNKSSFIDSFISPYEMKNVFEPKTDPIIQKEQLKNL